MRIPPRTSSGKKQSQSSEAVPALERTAAARIAALLSPKSAKRRGKLQVVDPKGQCLELPTTLTVVMYRAAELLAKGRPVAVLPEDEMLSTQEAADLLNVSRQYLVRLVDAGVGGGEGRKPSAPAGRRDRGIQGRSRRQASVGVGSPDRAQRGSWRLRD